MTWGEVAFSPVGNVLAATSGPREVSVHDLEAGQESVLWKGPDRKNWRVKNLAFSQDGSRLVIYVGSNVKRGDKVWVVKVPSGNVESEYSSVYSGSEFHGAACLSPDNQRLYLARSDWNSHRYSIRCIELRTNKELWETEPIRDHGITTLDISPNGDRLVSASGSSGALKLWHVDARQQLLTLHGAPSLLQTARWSPDGNVMLA